MLLEKAWAKVNGGYANIAAGITREALRTLTGASCKTFFTDEERNELWDSLMEAQKNNYIMTACTDDFNNGSDAYIDSVGICGSHAYSLLDVYEVYQ